MKRLLLAAAAAVTLPAFAGDVSLSIGVNEPNFFGQLTIGDMPRPAVIYNQPVVVERAPAYAAVEPIYLRVPPGHERHWSKHCAEYHACGRPVYFVREEWYQKEYAPRYRRHEEGRHEEVRREEVRHEHEREHDHGHGHGHDGDHGHDRDD